MAFDLLAFALAILGVVSSLTLHVARVPLSAASARLLLVLRGVLHDAMLAVLFLVLFLVGLI